MNVLGQVAGPRTNQRAARSSSKQQESAAAAVAAGASSSSNLPRPCPGTSSSSSLPRPCPGCPGTSSSSSSNLPRPAQHQQQQPVCGCARLAQQAVLRTGYNHVLLRAVFVHTHSHFNLGSAQQLQDRGIHSYLLCNYMDSNQTTTSSSSYREPQQQPTTAASTTSAAWLNRTLKVCGRVWSRSPYVCLNDKPKLPDPSTHCRIERLIHRSDLCGLPAFTTTHWIHAQRHSIIADPPSYMRGFISGGSTNSPTLLLCLVRPIPVVSQRVPLRMYPMRCGKGWPQQRCGTAVMAPQERANRRGGSCGTTR